MENIKKNIGVTFVSDLKSRKLQLGVEAQKKHDAIVALVERSKKQNKEKQLV